MKKQDSKQSASNRIGEVGSLSYGSCELNARGNALTLEPITTRYMEMAVTGDLMSKPFSVKTNGVKPNGIRHSGMKPRGSKTNGGKAQDVTTRARAPTISF